MTDLEIWEKACERVGTGLGPNIKPHCPEHGRHCIGDEGCCCADKHVKYPPIGDPACVVAMSEKVVKNPILWLHVFHLVEGGTVLPLALASAVIAIPVEKANAES